MYFQETFSERQSEYEISKYWKFKFLCSNHHFGSNSFFSEILKIHPNIYLDTVCMVHVLIETVRI